MKAQVTPACGEITIPPGYKRTEAGILPIDWHDLTIRDVCSLVNGRGFKPYEWRVSGLPIIRIQNLNGSEEFNYFDGSFNPKILVDEGQLLFAWSGSRGTSFGPHVWRGSQGLLNYHTWKVVANESRVDDAFLFHALRHLTAFIEEKAHGASALVHMQKWEMEGFHLAVPPLPEQRAIAAALSDVDALIGALDKLIVKKRAIQLAAMQQLLTGKTRLPGFVDEWTPTTLGELADIQRGASPRPIDSPVWYDRNSRVGWVRISDIADSDGRTLLSTRDYLSPKGVAASRFLPAGTLIMSICATVGRPIITGFDTCIHDGFVSFCNLKRVDRWFLFYKLKELESEFTAMGQTGSQANMNTDLVRGCELHLPTRAEQIAIAAVVSDMDAEITALERRRDKTKAIKQGMMQALLTGRVRLVKPADCGEAAGDANAGARKR